MENLETVIKVTFWVTHHCCGKDGPGDKGVVLVSGNIYREMQFELRTTGSAQEPYENLSISINIQFCDLYVTADKYQPVRDA